MWEAVALNKSTYLRNKDMKILGVFMLTSLINEHIETQIEKNKH